MKAVGDEWIPRLVAEGESVDKILMEIFEYTPDEQKLEYSTDEQKHDSFIEWVKTGGRQILSDILLRKGYIRNSLFKD